MKKVLPFSFDYVILKKLNSGISNRDEIRKVCFENFSNTLEPEFIQESINHALRRMAAFNLIEIKHNDAKRENYIAILSAGVEMVKKAYLEIAKEFHELEDNGKVV